MPAVFGISDEPMNFPVIAFIVVTVPNSLSPSLVLKYLANIVPSVENADIAPAWPYLAS